MKLMLKLFVCFGLIFSTFAATAAVQTSITGHNLPSPRNPYADHNLSSSCSKKCYIHRFCSYRISGVCKREKVITRCDRVNNCLIYKH